MALQGISGFMSWPNIYSYSNSGSTTTTWATLSAAGHYVCYVGMAAEDLTISHVGFLPGSVSGSPTLDVRIETVTAGTGIPSGTLWNTNTNVVSGTVSASTWQLEALTASATITRGQIFAVKLAYNSGTSCVLQRWSGLTVQPGGASGLPYSVTNQGSNSRASMPWAIPMALGSSATSFYRTAGLAPIASASMGQVFNNTSSAKRGLRFVAPFKCRCIGVKYFKGGQTGDFNIVLMNDAGTELSSSSTAITGTIPLSSAGAVVGYFDNPVTLDGGIAYRAVIEPTTTTNTDISFVTLPSSDYMSAWGGEGSAVYTTYTGSWTDSTTQLPLMDIIIDQIDVSSGGGAKVIGG